MLQATKIHKTQKELQCFTLRFLAHEYGLGGQTKLDDAKIDEVVDVVSDFQNALVQRSFLNLNKYNFFQYQAYFEKDETLKEEKMKKAQEETLPKSLVSLIEPN